jgi:hypothetical protein
MGKIRYIKGVLAVVIVGVAGTLWYGSPPPLSSSVATGISDKEAKLPVTIDYAVRCKELQQFTEQSYDTGYLDTGHLEVGVEVSRTVNGKNTTLYLNNFPISSEEYMHLVELDACGVDLVIEKHQLEFRDSQCGLEVPYFVIRGTRYPSELEIEPFHNKYKDTTCPEETE